MWKVVDSRSIGGEPRGLYIQEHLIEAVPCSLLTFYTSWYVFSRFGTFNFSGPTSENHGSMTLLTNCH